VKWLALYSSLPFKKIYGQQKKAYNPPKKIWLWEKVSFADKRKLIGSELKLSFVKKETNSQEN
jgi:hypothetical protein